MGYQPPACGLLAPLFSLLQEAMAKAMFRRKTAKKKVPEGKWSR